MGRGLRPGRVYIEPTRCHKSASTMASSGALRSSHPDSGRHGCALVPFSSIRRADYGAVECMLSFPVASVVSAEPVIPREYTPTRAACSRTANSEGHRSVGARQAEGLLGREALRDEAVLHRVPPGQGGQDQVAR